MESAKYILVARFGGLGNQLFQVAAGVVYSLETGKKLLLSNTTYTRHRTTKEDYIDVCFTGIEKTEYIVDDTHSTPPPGYRTQQAGFEAWSVSADPSNVFLWGYWQYYPPIGRHETHIRAFFLDRLPKCDVSRVGTVGIHVRRGDYLNHPNIHFLQNEGYYRNCMALFPHDTKFTLFSDDIAWCKSQDVFSACAFVEESNEFQALSQMTSCSEGFICANSTFSWWGAFLGPYANRKRICVPERWISLPVYDLFPPEWNII